MLWRRAPAWRWMVILATASTVLALYSPDIRIPPPCPPEFRDLISDYQVIDKITEKGRKCEELAKMADDINKVVQCPQAQQNEQKIYATAKSQAKSCVLQIEQSDRRLFDLRSRYDSYKGKSTTDKEQAFLKACSAILPFDKSRTLPADDRDLFHECDSKSKQAKGSLQRIRQLEQDYKKFQASGSVATEDRLITSAQAIVFDDEKRMDAKQLKDLEEARSLMRHRDQCLSLIQTLQSKLQAARTNRVDTVRIALVEAITEVDGMKAKTGYDCVGLRGQPKNARNSSPTGSNVIEMARKEAGSYSMEMLEKAVERLDFCQPDVALYERIRRLRLAMGRFDNTGLSTSQKEQLAKSDRVIALLDDSDRRLQLLSEAAKAWQTNSRTATQGVKRIYREILSFDMQRFGDDHSKAWDIVETAHDILSSRNPRDVPIYVEVQEGNQKAMFIKQSFEQQLRLRGLSIAEERARAGLVVRLNGVIGSPDSWGYRRVQLALTATWHLSDEEFYSTVTDEAILNSYLQQYQYTGLTREILEEFLAEIKRKSDGLPSEDVASIDRNVPPGGANCRGEGTQP